MRTILFLLTTLIFLQVSAQSDKSVFDIPIFAYHRFEDDRYPETNVPNEIFEHQLDFLKKNNFIVLTFGEAVKNWQEGKAFSDKTVILTIDDGYLSFYTHGWPLLKKYGFNATIFIQTSTVGGGDFMTWDQIREVRDAGIEIGNHSVSHAYFLNFPEKERAENFRSDLLESKLVFKHNLNHNPEYYAYPYGEWTSGLAVILYQEGIKGAVVQQSGVFSESSNQFAIPRFPMGGHFATVKGFKEKSGMKALRVGTIYPDSPFIDNNPPIIKINIIPGFVNIKDAQFFANGIKTEIVEINNQQYSPFVVLKADQRINARRTLYTLTAPSPDGKTWHWYSHLWVRPELK